MSTPSGSASRWMVAGAVVAVVTFLALAGAVVSGWSPLLALDLAAEPAVHREAVADPALLASARVVTALGSPVAMNLVTAVAMIALLLTRRVRPALYLVAARLLELGVETVAKALVDRSRPVWDDPVSVGTDTSFPSGHSAGTAVVVIALLLLGPLSVGRPATRVGRLGAGAGAVTGVLLLVAVPASRVVLGVHYPSDVTAGLALGAAVALGLGPILLSARSDSPVDEPAYPMPLGGSSP